MNASYIWFDATGEGDNRYALFRRTFTLSAVPARALIHVFADQRYRLLVNGEVLGHGPARFKLSHPEYDTYDLAAFLKPGRNTVAAMVCAYGQRTFITDDSRGSFIAWGDIQGAAGPVVDLATGPSWKAVRSAGHRETSQKMTFAIGLPELLDARDLPADWARADFDDAAWPAAVPLADQAHWGKLLPRSIPLLDESARPVRGCTGAWFVDRPDAASDHPFEASRHFAAAERISGGVTFPWKVPAGHAEAVSMVLTFGAGEVLGRPVVDITAPAGTIVDLLYTERLDSEGRPLHGYQNTRMAERYVCREGRQQWRAMHPRGFVYLEVVIRGAFERITLHDVHITQAAYPVTCSGSFACSDPVLERIWQLCRDTQQVCMEDAFLDCPWRERGLYTGDLVVQYLTNLALFGDHALMRRCVWLMFLTQDQSGLLGPCSHALKPPRHPDYAAIAVQALRLYWARSGDRSLVEEMQPRLVRLMDGLKALQVEGSHLADATDRSPYIDLAYFDRAGVSCSLNSYMSKAFRDAADLMRLLGDAGRHAEYAMEADAIAEAVRRGFWDPDRRLFVDRLRKDVLGTEPSLHANTLPLLYGIATREQEATALPFVIDRMKNNFRVPEPQQNRDCNVTPYFSFHPLQVLASRGHAREAEAFIRTYWGRYLEMGAVNTWEYFVPICSQCHAWSTSPVHFFAHEVLGVRFPEPGNPDKVAIAPAATTLEWAEGVYPHARGPIRVAWKRKQDGALNLSCEVPGGVDVQPRAG